ncbi:MAG: GAF domain-containing protein [Burkholderiales bacterium]
MARPSAELSRLQEISGAFYAGKMARDDARSAVIDLIFARLRCSRVSLWRFDGVPGDLKLLCFASKREGGALDTLPAQLHEREYRDYFDALVHNGMFVSVDAMADPALEPMRESYLVANHVRSLLDAAFMVNGRAYGMVCCEQTDTIRRWSTAEVIALRAMVAKLALLMASGGDEILWSSPSLPMGPLPLTA